MEGEYDNLSSGLNTRGQSLLGGPQKTMKQAMKGPQPANNLFKGLTLNPAPSTNSDSLKRGFTQRVGNTFRKFGTTIKRSVSPSAPGNPAAVAQNSTPAFCKLPASRRAEIVAKTKNIVTARGITANINAISGAVSTMSSKINSGQNNINMQSALPAPVAQSFRFPTSNTTTVEEVSRNLPNLNGGHRKTRIARRKSRKASRKANRKSRKH